MPNARVASRPTIDPTDMPSIAGAIIRDSPAIIDIIGSAAASSSGTVALPSDVAISVNR